MALKGMYISIIITCYNYEAYVVQAINSVTSQADEHVELIVVDDGSTDHSLNKIECQAKQHSFTVISKENGGQASAFNAGMGVARGELVWFLDADDYLLPGSISLLRESWSDSCAKLHAPMRVVDRSGQDLGWTNPRKYARMASGNIRFSYLMFGAYSSPPTSGTVYKRADLKQIFPMPEDVYRICADAYLKERSAFLGKIAKIRQPLAAYRIHGENNFVDAGDLSPAAAKIATTRMVNKYRFLLSKDPTVLTTFIRSFIFARSRHMRVLVSYDKDESEGIFQQLFPLRSSRWIYRLHSSKS
ncbi:MAG: glycosyltransferase family 2 protein [Alphaproteobacteria bacterium]